MHAKLASADSATYVSTKGAEDSGKSEDRNQAPQSYSMPLRVLTESLELRRRLLNHVSIRLKRFRSLSKLQRV